MQLYIPLPHRPVSTGYPTLFSKVTLTEGAECNFRKRIYAEMSETEPGEAAACSPAKPQLPEQQMRSLLCWKDGPSIGKATTTCTQQSWEFGMEHGREGGSFSIPLLIWKSVSIHPRHSWGGLFLPVANAEGNVSVLLQARMGHFTCAHRYRAIPTSQVFHSNTGQQVHLFHAAGSIFPK